MQQHKIEFDMLGSDPEFFLFDKQKQTIVSAINKIGGSKNNPLPLPGGSVLEDNVTAEINPIPASNEDEFVIYHQMLMNSLHEHLNKQYSFCIKDSHTFSKDYLENIGPKAFVSGCEPFFSNITHSEVNHVPLSNTDRYAGGHIHISFKDPEKVNIGRYVSLLDHVVLNPILRAKRTLYPRTSARSMTLYGQRGAFRVKEYGLEYRSPCNIWLRTEESMRWLWKAVQNSISLYNGKSATNEPFPITRTNLYEVGVGV
jgi:hypothetical protein